MSSITGIPWMTAGVANAVAASLPDTRLSFSSSREGAAHCGCNARPPVAFRPRANGPTRIRCRRRYWERLRARRSRKAPRATSRASDAMMESARGKRKPGPRTALQSSSRRIRSGPPSRGSACCARSRRPSTRFARWRDEANALHFLQPRPGYGALSR